jgi:hypothetical protein
LLGGAAILGALTIASALRPNGEPALSFWGDPLISWRFFGVRNHIMAFMCAGALAGASLLEFGNAAFVATAVASGFLVGAPWLGANYIGVTVLAFATTIVMLARMTDTVRWWHVLPGVLVAAGATIAALLSDRSHVSHGGRAVGAVGAHGIKAAWDIFRARASLDYHEVAHLGVWGYLGFIATAATIAYLIVRARTSPSADLPWLVRAGVFGVAAAAFVALFIEDSGFYTGGNLLLAPALAYVVARATRPQAGAGG